MPARLRRCAGLGAHLAPALLIAIASGPGRADDFSQYAVTPNQKSVAVALDRGQGGASFDALRLELSALSSTEIGGGLVQLGSEIGA